MRSRVLAGVLIAGVMALAVPRVGEARGPERGGGGHSSGGGHVRSGGHTGHGVPGHNGHRGPGYGGHGFRGWGPHRWDGGFHGWGVLTFPLWWDAYWWWGAPYGGYYGYYWPYDYFAYDDDSGDAGEAATPSNPAEEGAGAGAIESPEAGTSAVVLQITPPNALVVLNGVVVGSADEFGPGSDHLYLDAGEYALEFRAQGYRARVLRLTVSGGDPALVSFDLQADPAAGPGRAAPPSPGLPHGRRFSPSFGPATPLPGPPAVTGAAGAPAAPAPASTALVLRVSPPEAAVYVDGKLVGTAGEVAQLEGGVAVSPGAHKVDVVAPGHAGKTVQVEAQAGRKTELSVTLD